MYPKMKIERAQKPRTKSNPYPTMKPLTKAEQARKEGWRRATDEDMRLARMYPSTVERKDIRFDDPSNPLQGAWVRTLPPGQPDMGYQDQIDADANRPRSTVAEGDIV